MRELALEVAQWLVTGGSLQKVVAGIGKAWSHHVAPLQRSRVSKVRAERSMVVHAQLHASLQDVRPIAVEPVTPEEEVDWNATITAYHPLAFARAIGAHQRYWIRVHGPNGGQIVGALLFGAAAKALAARDEWIGWSHEERMRYRPRIVNNDRVLILPDVRIAHLASHALAMIKAAYCGCSKHLRGACMLWVRSMVRSKGP